MFKTRFICAGKSRHRDYRGEIAALSAAVTFAMVDTTQFKRAIDMTDDELAAIVAKARLTVVK